MYNWGKPPKGRGGDWPLGQKDKVNDVELVMTRATGRYRVVDADGNERFLDNRYRAIRMAEELRGKVQDTKRNNDLVYRWTEPYEMPSESDLEQDRKRIAEWLSPGYAPEHHINPLCYECGKRAKDDDQFVCFQDPRDGKIYMMHTKCAAGSY